jgi:ribonuclease P protein component
VISEANTGLRFVLPKKTFKTAVERNRIKRRIREIIRKFGDLEFGCVFFIYKSFSFLSFSSASVEITKTLVLFKKGVGVDES